MRLQGKVAREAWAAPVGTNLFRTPPARLDRPPHPGDVAYAALYFASSESAWVTGQFLDVEGGTGL